MCSFKISDFRPDNNSGRNYESFGRNYEISFSAGQHYPAKIKPEIWPTCTVDITYYVNW